MPRRLALTGPPGAQRHRLDGFRDLSWPDLWCAPKGGASGERVIRTRSWVEPETIDGLLVAPLGLVVRHLGAVPADLDHQRDGISPLDRIELAVEHALRMGVQVSVPQGARTSGEAMLARVLKRRGDHRPTGSYAETRMVQLLRVWGLTAWRQVEVRSGGEYMYTTDLLIPFQQHRRELLVVSPTDGVLLEVDSRGFHADNFDRDRHRDATYTRLGFPWLTVTARQIQRQQRLVLEALLGAFARAQPGGNAHLTLVREVERRSA